MDFIGVIFENPLYLFCFIIVGVCALGIFVWSRFGEAVKKRFRPAEKAQCLILTKSPRIEDERLLVDTVFYVSNEKTEEAWAYHPNAVQYNPDRTIAGLLLTHDTCLPQFVDPDIDLEIMYSEFRKAIRPIAMSQFFKAVETEIKMGASSLMGEWIGFAVVVAVAGVLVIVIAMLVNSMI